jgi:ribosomal protein S26
MFPVFIRLSRAVQTDVISIRSQTDRKARLPKGIARREIL